MPHYSNTQKKKFIENIYIETKKGDIFINGVLWFFWYVQRAVWLLFMSPKNRRHYEGVQRSHLEFNNILNYFNITVLKNYIYCLSNHKATFGKIFLNHNIS